jgi:pilus assembly protein CpaB
VKFLTPAFLTIILLLVVGGLVLAYVVKSLFAAEPEVAVERRNFPMAIADLEPGTVLTAAHLAMGPYPVTETKSTFARSDSILIGRVVKTALKAAKPIDTLDLYPPGEGPKPDLAPGMRAVSINLNDGSAAVDGLVKAGDYVDVHFSPTGYDDERFRGGLTMTMFKGVKVVKLDAASRASSRAITLELTPEQANILLLAERKGSLNMTYTPEGAGSGGVAIADADKAYFEEILGLAPAPEPEKPFVTEHYQRGGRNTRAFDENGLHWDNGTSYDGGDGNYGGNRDAPFDNGGREPTGGWGGSGYRGVSNPGPSDAGMTRQSDPNGAAARRQAIRGGATPATADQGI